jgi:rfaE bifunctional protein nucleotidyltransferase chain/domain
VIVFTNGVFDILHAGHVEYLQAASRRGALVVGVNSDASATRIKRRPINDERSRLAVVSALKWVRFAFLFDEDTPERLLLEVRPNIYVKGGDYNMDELPESALVMSWGGRAESIPYVDGYSTTDIIARIREGSIPR